MSRMADSESGDRRSEVRDTHAGHLLRLLDQQFDATSLDVLRAVMWACQPRQLRQLTYLDLLG